ncbi:hypothetical protein HJ033_23085 [Vibrio parahaemolyticus]|nr:hypothetical protein [Vibrio parahaemolyticus]MBE4372787.1 hypothetical protein [Vibrio parahaemolyticus]MBM4850968.1 hypothetical protein [Vibrio parahaemolyticus]HBC3436551.1 hypothetical protein [Vibrio parahaemolyticus]HBH7866867.1 hypothetical protein [Vibrio parahaemolyticus]
MVDSNSGRNQHDDLTVSNSDEPRSSNPLASASNITVTVPESVAVKLVDASALGDYEIWSLLTSILSSAVVGFVVAFLQADSSQKSLYGSVTGVFALLMIICAIMVIVKRKRLSNNTKTLKFSVGQQVQGE